MEKLRLGLLGYGTVGQGVVTLLEKNKQELFNRTGYDVSVSAIAKRNWDTVDKPVDIFCSTDSQQVVDHPDVDVVVELIGGESTAYDLVMRAIANKKHVVTANKALIASRGTELFKAAESNGVQIYYEASVAGGIPIIKSLKEGLASNQIQSVAGIINGTSNYILSAMRNEGRDFDDVLNEAQRLGYAEADPTFDIEGVDAAHKITILASVAYGVELDFSKVSVEGVSKINRQDVSYAEELGYRIKHLGIAQRRDNGIEIRVHPTLVPDTNLMSKVDGVMNAVRVFGNAVGETLFYGPGAGALPTASAVVSDVLSLVTSLAAKNMNLLGYANNHKDAPTVLDSSEHIVSNYLRMTVTDKSGVLANITSVLAKHNINIEAFIQKEGAAESASVPIVMLTKPVLRAHLDKALDELSSLNDIVSDIVRINVEHF